MTNALLQLLLAVPQTVESVLKSHIAFKPSRLGDTVAVYPRNLEVHEKCFNWYGVGVAHRGAPTKLILGSAGTREVCSLRQARAGSCRIPLHLECHSVRCSLVTVSLFTIPYVEQNCKSLEAELLPLYLDRPCHGVWSPALGTGECPWNTRYWLVTSSTRIPAYVTS